MFVNKLCKVTDFFLSFTDKFVVKIHILNNWKEGGGSIVLEQQKSKRHFTVDTVLKIESTF